MKMKRRGILLLVVLMALLAALPAWADDPYADCQGPSHWKETIPKGGSLKLYNWCHHEAPGDIDPQPPIGTILRLEPGQKVRLRSLEWDQATEIRCGKQDPYGWHEGTDFAVGSIVVVKCER